MFGMLRTALVYTCCAILMVNSTSFTLHTVTMWEITFMVNLDSIFKSRGITLPAKVRLVEAMAFLVVVYGCELDGEES